MSLATIPPLKKRSHPRSGSSSPCRREADTRRSRSAAGLLSSAR